MFLFGRRKKKRKETTQQKVPSQLMENLGSRKITIDLNENISIIKQLLGKSDDFVARPFHVFGKHPATLFYISNLNDKEIINADILKPLMYTPPHLENRKMELSNLAELLLEEVIYCDGRFENQLTKMIEAILRGETVVIIDGLQDAIVTETSKVQGRSVEQPGTEQVIRGPREGYVEQLGTNLSLIRYRLQTPDFRIKTMNVGRLTNSKVAICYVEGIVNPALVKEVEKRIQAIDVDAVLDAGYIEQFIEDNNTSPFPQIQYTERPDKTVAQMIEGRVAILVDGSPFALIVPTVFHQFYQTTEDYAERYLMSSAVRLIRLIALFFSLISSSLYVAVISYNPELIPTKFAVAVAGGRAGVPFPAVIEVFVMEVSMEILREATIRLPQQVGGALSIVGVLVIGQAAVSAGFVSPITVVVIALTTIGSFATPAYNAAMALRLLRFPIIFLAGTFGLYGVMIGIILVINHMLSLRSFGVPYMSPIVPGNFQGMKDVLIRSPLWWMSRRPALLHTPNDDRLSSETTKEIKQPPSNTLDPIKVGNRKGDIDDGNSS